MKKPLITFSFACISFYMLSCNHAPTANDETITDYPATDKELTEFIQTIKAVDNHTHANSIDPNDKDYDALPLDGLGNIELPARVRPGSPNWMAAAKAVYGISANK